MWAHLPPVHPCLDFDGEVDENEKAKIDLLEFCLVHKVSEEMYRDLQALLEKLKVDTSTFPPHLKTLRQQAIKNVFNPLVEVDKLNMVSSHFPH